MEVRKGGKGADAWRAAVFDGYFTVFSFFDVKSKFTLPPPGNGTGITLYWQNGDSARSSFSPSRCFAVRDCSAFVTRCGVGPRKRGSAESIESCARESYGVKIATRSLMNETFEHAAYDEMTLSPAMRHV